MLKILVVDDETYIHKMYRDHLELHVEIVEAYTLEHALAAWANNSDVDLIIMDGCLHGDHPDTISLIQKIRETYAGHIIAASSDAGFRDQLMAAGCSHNADGPKRGVPNLVLRILGIE